MAGSAGIRDGGDVSSASCHRPVVHATIRHEQLIGQGSLHSRGSLSPELVVVTAEVVECNVPTARRGTLTEEGCEELQRIW